MSKQDEAGGVSLGTAEAVGSTGGPEGRGGGSPSGAPSTTPAFGGPAIPIRGPSLGASVPGAASDAPARSTVAIGALNVPAEAELRALRAAGVLREGSTAAAAPGALHTRQLPMIADRPAPASPQTADHPTVRPAFERPKRGVAAKLRRVGPLAALVVAATAGVLALAFAGDMRATPGAGAVVDAPVSERVALPAVRATYGLTEDNKEAVLSLCWRVSSNPNTECRRSYLVDTGEYPHRELELGAFSVDRDEVSNAAWAECEAAGQCAPRDLESCRVYSVRGLSLTAELGENARSPERPAACVTYDEAASYCAAQGGRLPTVEEWERVARAGGELLQPWGQFWSPAMANWGERDMGGFPIPGRLDGHEFAAPVDAYRDGATSDGVRNVLGNVGEWVQPSDLDREGRAGVRGGNFSDDLAVLRSTRHRSLPRATRRNTVGFRCVYEQRAP